MIRYPEARVQVLAAVEALADPEYQRRVWIRGELPKPEYVDDLTVNVHILFDDFTVLPDPAPRAGYSLYPDEVEPLRALGAVLDPLLDELDGQPDERYLEHPQWTEVVRAAASAWTVMRANEQ